MRHLSRGLFQEFCDSTPVETYTFLSFLSVSVFLSLLSHVASAVGHVLVALLVHE